MVEMILKKRNLSKGKGQSGEGSNFLARQNEAAETATTEAGSTNGGETRSPAGGENVPDPQEIARKVYELFCRDLDIERQRCGRRIL